MTFQTPKTGAYVLVDGQFGSTGKGLLASYLAERTGQDYNVVVSNAGPNSGHTSYFHDEKIVLKQLPTFAVMDRRFGNSEEPLPVYLSAGAVINPDLLNKEVEQHGMTVFLNTQATLIRPEDVLAEGSGAIAAVAGTRQGVGAALARKVWRYPDAIVSSWEGQWSPNIQLVDGGDFDWSRMTSFVEVSQGFSLGIHSKFYPKVTSRECTAAQALADARIPPQLLNAVAMVIRAHPIRVGNFEGHSSGECYPDQKETSWEEIGVDAELTTVTQRVRRVFTFSFMQYREALLANRPALVFVNFMNYIKDIDDRRRFAANLIGYAEATLGYQPQFLWGYGPKNGDVHGEII
jgi:adenylosuccinate synthase